MMLHTQKTLDTPYCLNLWAFFAGIGPAPAERPQVYAILPPTGVNISQTMIVQYGVYNDLQGRIVEHAILHNRRG